MKVVVTGGAGFIGHHLVRALLGRHDEVRVIDNYAGGRLPGRMFRGVGYVDLSVEAPVEELAKHFANARYVFHLAALPRVQYSIEHPEKTERVNVIGTQRVLEAARIAGVSRVVFASSSSVYGEPDTLPLTEDMPLNPMSPYAEQKAASEAWCREYAEARGVEAVSLRLFNVYGPGADPSGAYALVVAKFIEQRGRGKPMTITGDGTQTRDFTHVSDVAHAFLLAAESPAVGKGEVINIGGGRQISINEVARLIGGPSIHVEKRHEPHDTLADISRAKTLLQWEPRVPFEWGIEELAVLHELC